jgi:hypothetical protein
MHWDLDLSRRKPPSSIDQFGVKCRTARALPEGFALVGHHEASHFRVGNYRLVGLAPVAGHRLAQALG